MTSLPPFLPAFTINCNFSDDYNLEENVIHDVQVFTIQDYAWGANDSIRMDDSDAIVSAANDKSGLETRICTRLDLSDADYKAVLKLNNLSEEEIENLDLADLNKLSDTQLSLLDARVLNCLPPRSIRDVLPRVLKNLSDSALQKIEWWVLNGLALNAYTELQPRVLNKLSDKTIKKLEPNVFNYFSKKTLEEIESRVFKNASDSTIMQLSLDTVNNLKESIAKSLMHLLSPSALEAIIEREIASITQPIQN
ncbi:hypothetical protein [Pseudochelatococcus sp. G4_1912]|uniref:hypothetical protein n=1 Tax=Pseudochelatococcus sp. G4_1912 TaxID=3114288 RepID=UPI0039C5CA9C